jgi:hypothetical protein
LVSYGGSFTNEKQYPIGRINSIVYPVDGGMEDWMYAAGWDQSSLKKCKAFTPLQPGVDKEPDVKEGNRAIVYLVETSDMKNPNDDSLGGSENPLDKNSSKSGHISRNARIALVSIDVAMPYNCIQSYQIHDNAEHNNIKDPTHFKNRKTDNLDEKDYMNNGTKDNTKESNHDTNDTKTDISSDFVLDLKWYVGGAVNVDATWISVHTPPNPLETSIDHSNWSHLLSALKPPAKIPPFASPESSSKESSPNLNNKNFKKNKFQKKKMRDRILEENYMNKNKNLKIDSTNEINMNQNKKRVLNAGIKDSDRIPNIDTHLSYAHKGRGRWARNNNPLNPEIFSTTVKVTSNMKNQNLTNEFKYLGIGLYWLVAWSTVDSTWGSSKQGHGSETPQSHLANGRTNLNWKSKSDMNFRINESNPNLNSKKPLIKDRVIKGRKLWPSDPIIIEVLTSGEIILVSSILHCAHWDRIVINDKNISKNSQNENIKKIKNEKKNISKTVTKQNYSIENGSYQEYSILFFIVIFVGFLMFLYRYIKSFFNNTSDGRTSSKDTILQGKYSKVRQNDL